MKKNTLATHWTKFFRGDGSNLQCKKIRDKEQLRQNIKRAREAKAQS